VQPPEGAADVSLAKVGQGSLLDELGQVEAEPLGAAALVAVGVVHGLFQIA
jgi:hypothetical protein